MDIYLVNTDSCFKCASEDDLQKKHRLRPGEVYRAHISYGRNYRFHRKYFAMISQAWQNLTEQQQAFFNGSQDCFRKTCEIAAGYFEPVFSVARGEWIQQSRSIAFDKMSEEEFQELYKRVWDVLFALFLRIPQSEFSNQLQTF
jgi:hypothetical protein